MVEEGEGGALLRTTLVAVLAGLLVLVLGFGALKVVSGELNAQDVVGRLPDGAQSWWYARQPLDEGVAAVACPDLDESDPAALLAHLEDEGLEVVVTVTDAAGNSHGQPPGDRTIPDGSVVREATVDGHGRVDVWVLAPGAAWHDVGYVLRPGGRVCPADVS